MRVVPVCVLACVLPLTAVQARPRAPVLAPECNVSMPCDAPAAETSRRQARAHWRKSLASVPPNASIPDRSAASAGISMAGVVPALAAKISQIQSACPGAHIISAVRRTRINGSRHMSLHATGEAVDMRGNPSCVYAQLKDWPGGYSTDYGRARHIHISLAANGREAGLRFAHGGRSHRHHRFAKR